MPCRRLDVKGNVKPDLAYNHDCGWNQQLLSFLPNVPRQGVLSSSIL